MERLLNNYSTSPEVQSNVCRDAIHCLRNHFRTLSRFFTRSSAFKSTTKGLSTEYATMPLQISRFANVLYLLRPVQSKNADILCFRIMTAIVQVNALNDHTARRDRLAKCRRAPQVQCHDSTSASRCHQKHDDTGRRGRTCRV